MSNPLKGFKGTANEFDVLEATMEVLEKEAKALATALELVARADAAKDLIKLGKELNKSKFAKAVTGLKKTVKEIGKGMGLTVLMTALKPFMMLLEIFSPILEVISALFEVLVGEILIQLMPLMEPIMALLLALLPVFRLIGKAIGGFIKWLIGEGGIVWVFQQVWNFFKFIGEFIIGTFINLVLKPWLFVFQLIGAGIKAVVDTIAWLWNNVLKPIFDGIMWVFGQIGNVFKGIINFIIDIINGVMKVITLGFWGNIPHFAQGGVVTKPTVALIGEQGPERITPMGNKGNQGGMGMDTSELVSEMQRANEINEQMLIYVKRQAKNVNGKRRYG